MGTATINRGVPGKLGDSCGEVKPMQLEESHSKIVPDSEEFVRIIDLQIS